MNADIHAQLYNNSALAGQSAEEANALRANYGHLLANQASPVQRMAVLNHANDVAQAASAYQNNTNNAQTILNNLR
jgi:hypothetical protein